MSDAYDCPKCGGPMEIRTVKAQSKRRPQFVPGHCFMGCMGFPKCRGLLEYFGPTAEGARLSNWLHRARQTPGVNDTDVLMGALMGAGGGCCE